MDSYQPIYDAVRSRIRNGNIGDAIAEVARQSFDISHLYGQVMNAVCNVELEMIRPSVLFRPKLCIDGNKWCALLGENLQVGVAGFGDSPEEAMRDFDKAWTTKVHNPPSPITPEPQS